MLVHACRQNILRHLAATRHRVTCDVEKNITFFNDDIPQFAGLLVVNESEAITNETLIVYVLASYKRSYTT